jgi:hypothetical protein
MVLGACTIAENLLCAGGVVAADIDEGFRVDLLQARQDQVAIGGIWLVAGGTQRRTGGAGDEAQPFLGKVGEIGIIAVAYAAHAMQGTEYARSRMALANLKNRAGQRLVDDRGGAAALRDDESSGHADLPNARNIYDCASCIDAQSYIQTDSGRRSDNDHRIAFRGPIVEVDDILIDQPHAA